MSQQTTVKFSWNRQKLAGMERYALLGMFRMGYDIAAQARANAPVVSGALRNSIRTEADDTTIYIRAGGTISTGTSAGRRFARLVDYAEKREIGPNRNPATVHYMQNARIQIMSGDYMKKYFGGITR